MARTARKAPPVNSAGHTMQALMSWWQDHPKEADAFHEALETLASPDAAVRAEAALDATALLKARGVSWTGLVAMMVYVLDDGRDLPPY